MSTQFPFVKMPDRVKLVIDLLSLDPHFPPQLAGNISAQLPNTFPESLPWVRVAAVPGAGFRPVPQRLASGSVDIHVYALRDDEAQGYALTIEGILQSMIGKSTSEGGMRGVEVQSPFPLPDTSTAYRWIVSASLVYRPL